MGSTKADKAVVSSASELANEDETLFCDISRDKVTGLLDQAGFYKETRALIDKNPHEHYVLVYGDIDRFKVFNDLFGTEQGDRLLAAIGSLLAGILPQGSVAARLRADHFVVCIPERLFNLERIMAKLDAWFAAYPSAFTFFYRLGICVIDDPHLDVALMADRALIALRVAKNATGTRKYTFYDDSLRSSLLKEQEMVGEMETAMREKQFQLYFQPQYRYSTRTLYGAEVLARWNHPTKGLVGPGDFIPVFERNGLISRFDFYIWERACQTLRVWLDTRPAQSIPALSLNLSRADIYYPGLCGSLQELMEAYHIPREYFHLEITESAYMDSPDQLIEAVSTLRKAGFSVHMDDFGSGFSSLNTLKDVPVDALKLDMKFLDARNNTRGGIVLASIVRMARWLDLPVIAEGVETQTQADYLASIGCDIMQGYLFSRPLDQSSFEQLLDGGHCLYEKVSVQPDEQPDDVWDADSHMALLFNRFVGAACIAEYVPTREELEIVRGNDAFRELFQYDDEELKRYGTNFLRALTDQDRMLFTQELDRVIQGRDEGSCEFQIRTANKDVKWLRVRLRRLSQAAGVYSIYLQFEETTEEQTLRARLQATIESIPGGLAFLDVTRTGVHLLYFSDATVELSGFTWDHYEEQGKPDVHSMVHVDDRDKLHACFQALLDGQKHASCTVRLRHQTGEYTWVHISASPVLRESDSLCVVAVLVDVTAEHEARLMFEEQASAYKRLYEAIPCGVVRFSADGKTRLISMNRTGCNIFGCTDYEDFLAYAGDDPFKLFPPEVEEKQRSSIAKLAVGEKQIPFKCQAFRKDGATIWISGIIAMVKDPSGQDVVQSAFNDVTHNVELHWTSR